MNAVFGLLLHALGGFAAGSFYVPTQKVKGWAWESSWLVLGLMAWLIVPAVAAALTVPGFREVIAAAPTETLMYTYGFGVLWGIGGLTFGLALRYLGVSLGMAVALGFTAAVGTVVPPLYAGTLGALAGTTAGAVTLLGVVVCLGGIAFCGRAGILKEKALLAAVAEPSVGAPQELDDSGLADGHGVAASKDAGDGQDAAAFSMSRGLTVAVVSGILSACFAFGLAAGAPISEGAVAAGADSLFQNNATLVVLLLGGLTTNGLYCLWLNIQKRSYVDYGDSSTPLAGNYAWASLGGATWYMQFFLYGMGATLLGERFEFASWTLHMAFIIMTSTLWGLYLGEWRGAGPAARRALWTGLGVIGVSTVMIGLGSGL